MARSRKREVWADWAPPGPKQEDPGGDAPLDAPPSPADAADPAPKTHLVPLFPIGGLPYTPHSPCPHWCKRCSGSGVVGIDSESDAPVECPDCLDPSTGKGTGESRPGGDFVCMTCFRAGKDGSPALPLDVEPLPPGPTIAERRASRREAARERARLEAYVKKGLQFLEKKRGNS